MSEVLSFASSRRAAALLTLLLLAVLALPRPAPAEPAAPGETAAVRQVIEGQLQAFQRDDGGAAFGYATPILQRKFGNPDRFMQMVQSGYDPVYRPREVEFQGAELAGEGIIQKVLFVDRNGRAWLARYTMERMGDGSWKIGGVWLEALPDLST